MRKAIVERVPEVADSASLLPGHAEAVLVGGKVSGTGLAAPKSSDAVQLTFATLDSYSR